MAFDVTQPVRADSEMQLGVVLQAGSATLGNVVDQIAHFLQMFGFLLLERHQWRGDRNNSKQTWAYFRHQVLRDLWLRSLTDADEDDDETPDDQAS